MRARILLAPTLLALAPLALAAAPQRSAATAPIFIPYGAMEGSWSCATLQHDGSVSGLLKDGAGQPLWALDAKLSPSGELEGSLLPLEYAGNPVELMGALAVLGDAAIGADGKGTFHLVIHQPQLGLKPIYALGFIDGDLLDTRPGTAKLALSLAATSQVGARARASHLPRGVIEDPWDPGISVQGFQSAGAHAAAGLASGPALPVMQGTGDRDRLELGLQRAGVIVCPKGREAQGAGLSSSAGSYGQPSGGHKPAGVIQDPWVAGIDLLDIDAAVSTLPAAQATEGRSNAGHQVPPSGSGKAEGRWFFLDY
jgi:hypothetical protein